ncbi:unnamed protein product [Eruca vesicaria subsp. sativa]|uniref:Tify domain-containing protein n=1 Tax=Eruca vesicaria subsp. sativa TaxID=29727 RepID=A0ABC8JEU9_ERUVS|nr:unnamed protein product [Eruca vesicaria subsp. sativa]
MRKDLGRRDIEEIPCSGSSRMELKRSHQWLTEESGSELFSSKRQVLEIDGSCQGFLTPHMSLSTWESSLVPRQLTDCLFDPANVQQTSDLHGRNIEEQCGSVSSIGFPVVHGSSFDLDASRKVTVNEVCESGNIPEAMVQFYGEGISRSFENGPSYDNGQDDTLSFGQTCSNIDNSFILPGPLADGNFIPNFSYDKGDENFFSTVNPFVEGVENFALMTQSLQKADSNLFSMSPSYIKRHENFMPLLPCDKLNDNVAFMVSSQDRAGQNNDRVSHEDRTKTISFGGYQRETDMGVINSYDNFGHAPATTKVPLHMEAEENMSFEFRSPPYACPGVDTLLVPTSKDSKTTKKGSTNTFPSNVKSLLSTGMLDGVTVKYYSWSRETNLKGVIKGTGYLCGCGDCNLKKVLNAYEFEQHANCKTKHPNNHIYFENGKTIYGVVQELKNTPQEKLFDAIQNVTGSVINHKNFNTWKASYQVASLELQRIYGKDTVTLAS